MTSRITARRGGLAAVTALGLALGLAGAAHAAGPTPQGAMGVMELPLLRPADPVPAPGGATVTDGSIAWGYKESFRRYVGSQTAAMPPIGALPEGERITVSGGASFDPAGTPAVASAASNPNETLPYLFTVAGGTYTDTGNLTVDATGTVAYHFPSHAFEASISDVSLVVTGGKASLVGDMVVDVQENAFGYAPGHFGGPDVTIATVDNLTVTPAAGGTSVTVTAAGLKATTAASQAMHGFLSEGDVLDSLALAVNLQAATPQPGGTDPEIPVDVVIPEQQPEPEPGELTMTVDTAASVSLGTATAGASGFTSTGALNPVTVKDTRENAPGWKVTGTASAFTSSTASFAGSRLGWTPKVTVGGAGAVAGPDVTPGAGAAAGLAQSATLASAPAGHELGQATIGADLALNVPLDTPAGSYSAVLTLTVVG